jgi:hypothetical protein
MGDDYWREMSKKAKGQNDRRLTLEDEDDELRRLSRYKATAIERRPELERLAVEKREPKPVTFTYDGKDVTIDMASMGVKDEQVLWSARFGEQIAIISNFRFYMYETGTSFVVVGALLKELEAVVANQTILSQYKSAGLNTSLFTDFFGLGSVIGSGISTGQTRGTSEIIGSMLMFSQGKVIARLDGIPDPQSVKNLVDSVKAQLYRKEGTSKKQGDSASSKSFSEELASLASMMDRGLLTADEFQKAKAKLFS